MARPRTKLGSDVERKLLLRSERGEPTAAIAQALGLDHSLVKRRVRELRGGTAKASEVIPPVDVPAEIPSDAAPGDLAMWLARVERGCTIAEERGNLGALSSLSAKAAAIVALQHRMRPIPKEDPNDRLEFQAMAKQGEARFCKLIEGLFEGSM